jgi:SAM-dependent methyltransferase
MLRGSVRVLRRQLRYVQGDAERTAAYRAGLRTWYGFYGQLLAAEVVAQAAAGEWRRALRGMAALIRELAVSLRNPVLLASAALPVLWRQWRPMKAHLQGYARDLGSIRRGLRLESEIGCQDDSKLFSNLRRLTPISRDFGYDRGQPIDRYYIEQFLTRHAQDVQGRVLEIGDDAYTGQFGRDRVRISDVLDVDDSNAAATIVGALAYADHIRSDTFDCIILTQTLHLIYDVSAAIRTLHRILKPGGILLATFPGVSQIARDRRGETWYWGFTTLSAKRLFAEAFPAGTIRVESRGNVLTAIGFLHGLAAEELRQEELDFSDPTYQVLIMLRAEKPVDSVPESTDEVMWSASASGA